MQNNQAGETQSEQRTVISSKAVSVFESRPFANDHLKETSVRLRALYSAVHTELDAISIPHGSEAGRLLAMSKTELEASNMWATKALSRFSPPNGSVKTTSN